MEPIAIIGWAMSEQASHMVSSRDEMVFACVKEALETTGISREDLDTVISNSNDFYDGHTISQVYLIDPSGAYAKDESKVEQDGIHAALYAYMRLLAGTHHTAMIVSYSRASDGEVHAALAAQLDPTYERQFKFLNDTALAALQARAYMEKYGVGEEALAQVTLKNLNNAVTNPKAKARGPVASVDEVMASPMAFSPLRELMVYPETDGICVLLLANEAGLKRLGKKPLAWIKGMGWNQELHHAGERDLSTIRSAQLAARQAYKMAGVTPKQVDVAEVSEMFAHQELMLSEALGFAPPGKGADLLFSGATRKAGKLPINPSGGALAACALNAVGLIRMVEAAKQLCGRAENQVKGARVAVAHGQCGPAAQNNVVAVLTKTKS
jgi:acetyl-CoA C-acetyltransferase